MGDVGYGDQRECNGPDACARIPHRGCMCGTFGPFVCEKMEWQTASLSVHLAEYEEGTIWILIYGHGVLGQSDTAFLDEIMDLAGEAQICWTASVPAIAPGARLHGYGVVG